MHLEERIDEDWYQIGRRAKRERREAKETRRAEFYHHLQTSKKILDFDIENRPLTYLGEVTTAEITALAYGWVGKPKSIKVSLLESNDDGVGVKIMLEEFRDAWEEAEMVTGHYIRNHDLPIINGSMMQNQLALLSPKYTCDTKNDLANHGQALSASQENLAAMLALLVPKVHMNNFQWQVANRLTDEGRALTAKRAKGDVIQHMALRKKLYELGYLKNPSIWRPF